ncbi:MAG: M1 family metallopeptidase [Candidatus Obscuribacterales bacterium]|nr:M1 family metallopeptidase [Candidatus Obscuribacterales bacterium]
MATARFSAFGPGVSKKLLASTISIIAAASVFSFCPNGNCASAQASKTSSLEENAYKLPKFARPQSYDLTFTPDLKNFTFEGSSIVELTLEEASKFIVMNALDLEIKKATIKSSGGSEILEGKVSLDPEHELARIEFPKTLERGNYRLEMAFTGTLNDKLRGFYRSHYLDAKGTKHWLATTQMEPTDARRMFPGFDEPEMKATFKITAKIDPEYAAISNGAIESEGIDPESKKKVVKFEASPRMSSYLVALIIGDFRPTDIKETRGVKIRVWAPAGKEVLGKYSLDEACKILDYQSDYFGIPYPGKKLDLIAIPDFRSGAMENMGAITFREANFLVDEKTGSNFLKRRATEIVAHEIAHQWFGDLVTMRWWDDIWLNEAFASWMATKTVNVIHPEWSLDVKSVDTRNGAMDIDELKATRAIHAEVKDAKQAAEMFDPITYDKGESVLGMLETFVGDKQFQAGIHDYLEAAKFGNATSEDLWQSIGKKTQSADIPAVMKTWVFQAGFPLISLKRLNNKQFSLTQERFFSDPEVKSSPELWQAPIALRPLTAKSKAFPHLLEKKNELVNSTAAEAVLLANAGGNGFYRVHYEPADLDQIISKMDQLTPKERLVFLNDLFAQVARGSLPVERRLEMIQKAPSETDPIVQEYIVASTPRAYYLLSPANKPIYQKLLREKLGIIKNQIGWTEKAGENDSVKDLRATLLNVEGTIAQDPQSIEEARRLFAKYQQDRQSVPADIAKTMLSIVGYNGSDDEYNKYLSIWKSETVPELEKRIFSALATFRKAELVERTLKLVMSDEVRAQDGFGLLSSLLSNRETNVQAWTFVKAHWDEIVKKFPPRTLSQIALACGSFDLPEQESDLRDFFSKHELSYGKSAVARMLELAHQSVLFRSRAEANVNTWVARQ